MNESAMFLPPEMMSLRTFGTAYSGLSTGYSAAMYKNGEAFEFADDDGQERLKASYLSFNGISYAPLRVVLEFFGFDVEYDEKVKMITIKGELLSGESAEPLFSEDQVKIINALASFDNAKILNFAEISGYHIAGGNDYSGSDLTSSVLTRESDSTAVGKLIRQQLTLADGNKYETVFCSHKLSVGGTLYPVPGGGISGGVSKILPDGKSQALSMFGSGISHPLLVHEAGTTVLSGSNKYRELKKNISSSYCYEINSVAFGLCNPSLIKNATDRKTAEPLCGNCKNVQMTA